MSQHHTDKTRARMSRVPVGKANEEKAISTVPSLHQNPLFALKIVLLHITLR